MSRNILTEETKQVIIQVATPAFTIDDAVIMLRDKEVVEELQEDYEYSDEAICYARWFLQQAQLLGRKNVCHNGAMGHVEDGEPRHYTAYDINRLAEIVFQHCADERNRMNEGGEFILCLCEAICRDRMDDPNSSCDPSRDYTFFDGSVLRIGNPLEAVYPMCIFSSAKEG